MEETISFDVGTLEKIIQIKVKEDTTPETTEIFYVELFDPVGRFIS